MTRNAAEKRVAREHARRQGISYRCALAEVREAQRLSNGTFDLYVSRLLIEAIEGCGVRHWARVEYWDGATSAILTDVGGERFVLNASAVGQTLRDFLVSEPHLRPMDLDSFHADVVIQQALFGCTIYRSEVRRRPQVAA